MRIIFFGSDNFAVTNLEGLIKDPSHEVIACVTPPDKAKGRGLKIGIPAVKESALKNKIPVLQPADINDAGFRSKLKSFKSDLFVVIAYGYLLPAEIFSLPRLFSINVHGSLLPKYRGAAPVNWAIINGETKTGVSIIKMSTAMDAGDIISHAGLSINSGDTAVTLRERMAKEGAKLLVKTVNDIEAGKYSLKKQDTSLVTRAPKLTKDMGLIAWDKDAEDIHNLVRGLLPWPCAYARFDGRQLKILETEVTDVDCANKSAGQVVSLVKEGFVVACGRKSVLVRRVHPESGKAMDARSFAVGRKLEEGTRLS